jgi:hypothetical protein
VEKYLLSRGQVRCHDLRLKKGEMNMLEIFVFGVLIFCVGAVSGFSLANCSKKKLRRQNPYVKTKWQ